MWMGEVEDGGSTKVFIEKRVSKEDRACVKNLESSDGLAQIRPELYRLVPEARTWKISQSF
jgi:hypothetical protein